MTEETVRIDISIDIRTEAVIDTGLTVSYWNALTDEQRSAIAQAAWNGMAEQDSGGMSVVTEGAEGI